MIKVSKEASYLSYILSEIYQFINKTCSNGVMLINAILENKNYGIHKRKADFMKRFI